MKVAIITTILAAATALPQRQSGSFAIGQAIGSLINPLTWVSGGQPKRQPPPPPRGYPPQGYTPQGYAPQGYAPQGTCQLHLLTH